jgi:hypothetical protein
VRLPIFVCKAVELAFLHVMPQIAQLRTDEESYRNGT